MRSRFKNLSLIVAAKLLIVFAALALLFMFSPDRHASGQDQDKPERKPIDPKAWGGNHVGKPVPEFVQGDECLFCHRNTIGVTWQTSSHGATLRQREDAPELVKLFESHKAIGNAAEYFLGSRSVVRFLKKEGYGKFAILNAKALLAGKDQPAKLIDGEKLTWDKEKFANRCAGCHATGIDAATRTFSAFGLDCYACHGDVTLEHTKDTSLILLSKKRRNDARVITSLCAQCHLREGKSTSTGLPYPNNFVAGDNLFQDFEVDWAKADEERLNAGDRHVWRNVRDVAVNGNESITCLSCHQVHGGGGFKHRRVLRASICAECHAQDSFKNPKPYAVHSSLCEY